MGSNAAQTYRDRTKVQNWHTISADSVSWANVTTLIVSPKLVRLLVIRGKYLITSGLPCHRSFNHADKELARKASRVIPPKADSREPKALFLDEIFRFSGLRI
jgi:hypothetical protein